MTENIIALLIGILIGGSILYFWYLKMKRIQRFIKTSGILESYKSLKIERDELAEANNVLSANNLIMQKTLVSFAQKEKECKDLHEQFTKNKELEIWRFGQLMMLLNKRGFVFTSEELDTLTPDS